MVEMENEFIRQSSMNWTILILYQKLSVMHTVQE